MSVPRFIVVLVAVDLALGLAYVGYFLMGRRYEPLARLIDLDGEANGRRGTRRSNGSVWRTCCGPSPFGTSAAVRSGRGS